MQKVKPVITNIDSDFYRFLRTIIYEERCGGEWYIFSLTWFLAMIIITTVVISGLGAMGPTYMSTIGEDHPSVILYKFFINLINAFVLYLIIGFTFDCIVFPICDSKKEWL